MTYTIVVALAGALAVVIQELRVQAARSSLASLEDRYSATAKMVEDINTARNEDVQVLQALLASRSTHLAEVMEVCRASDDPTVVRARLRLLLDPAGKAAGPASAPSV